MHVSQLPPALPLLDPLLPVALAAAAAVVALRLGPAPASFARSATFATVGTLVVAYGVREFLRAVGGGYYCCNHAVHATAGALVTGLGWAVLFVGLAGPVSALTDGTARATSAD